MLRGWLIEKLGGFSSVEQAIDSIEDNSTRNMVLTKAVRKLFNTIDADDILQPGTDGQWLLEGRILSKERTRLLSAQAKDFIDSDLWKTIKMDIKYQANEKLFVLSKTESDLVAGKLWLFTLKQIGKRLKEMSKGSAGVIK